MGLALMWFFQGAFVLCAAHAAHRLVGRWREAIARVTMYPGAAAVGAWVALQSLPVAITTFVVGVVAVQLGLTTLGAFLATGACTIGFAAACGIGLLMPNLGVERHRTYEST